MTNLQCPANRESRAKTVTEAWGLTNLQNKVLGDDQSTNISVKISRGMTNLHENVLGDDQPVPLSQPPSRDVRVIYIYIQLARLGPQDPTTNVGMQKRMHGASGTAA